MIAALFWLLVLSGVIALARIAARRRAVAAAAFGDKRLNER